MLQAPYIRVHLLYTLSIIYIVKVRLQTPAARYKGTLDCVISTVRQEKVSNATCSIESSCLNIHAYISI